jgi:signal transduction histidine kinase
MDMRMPVMDGVEATRAIDASGQTIPILIHSAYGDDSLVLEALKAGARGYVVKGSAMSDIVSAITHMHAGESHISDEVTRPLIDRLVDALATERAARVAAQQAAKMIERSAAQQKEFAIQAAHELRTPMTSLIGALEMLGEGTAELGPAVADRLVGSALEGTRRLARLTENLEVVATGDDVSVIPAPTPIGPVVDEVVRDLGASDRVRVDVDGLSVRADGSRLRQMIHNVLQNALGLRASDPTIDIAAAIDGDDVLLSISDRGPGFDASVREALFEPFHHKIDAAHGLGVGLSVVKQLADRMDGSIEVADRLGGGSVVTLGLPAVSP